MSKLLFLFLDGIGLGKADPQSNPLVQARMPFLKNLLDGNYLLAEAAPLSNGQVSLLALDATLGVPGLPQSATGQAALLTGKNVAALIGEHYGPKPNPAVREHLENGTLFSTLKEAGRSVAFLNAYPPSYYQSIQSGHRLYAAIPQAAVFAGIPLRTIQDLRQGQALSADFTARGWQTHLGLEDISTLLPHQAGKQLALLAGQYDFSFFEYWLSDFAGHRREMGTACRLLETFDQVLSGLLSEWDPQSGLILITSDHGNMEDMDTRRHTYNPVPALLLGSPELRGELLNGTPFASLTDVAPAILRFLGVRA